MTVNRDPPGNKDLLERLGHLVLMEFPVLMVLMVLMLPMVLMVPREPEAK